MKPLPICSLISLLWILPVPVMAGVIHGTIRVPSLEVRLQGREGPEPVSDSSMSRRRRPHRVLASDAVVYVDRVPAHVESALAAAAGPPARVAQRNRAFVPRVLAVAASSSVEFPNHDSVDHWVFSLSPVGRFDLGRLPGGVSRSVRFPKAGVVNVYCDLDSHMEAFVLVLPHHGFARPTARGEFRLPALPPGSYVLHVWHPDLGRKSQPVQVPEMGEVVADLSFRP